MHAPTDAEDLAARVRHRFDVSDERVTALSSLDLEDDTSQARVRDWQRNPRAGRLRTVEHLVPRIRRPIVRAEPAYAERSADGLGPEALAAEVARLAPWQLPFDLGQGVHTLDGMRAAVARQRLLYRRDLIAGTLADLLGDDLAACSVLDIGCQVGFFSLELAERGAASVLGLDLRPENIAQARFLAAHHGVERVAYEVADADELVAERTFDVVLNLGLLYHVTRPLDLLRTTRLLTGRVAVVDTVCSTEPVSAFLLLGDKDVAKADEGRDVVELHPTYRAVIDGLHFAGFREVVEVEGLAEPVHDTYAAGRRRCFLAFP